MARQQLLDGDGAPRVRALIDEAALTRPPLAPPQARAQLDRLIALTERPQVTVRIVPTTENSRSPHPSFTILEFAEADRPDVVYLEEPDGARYLDQPAEVARYRDVLNSLDSPAAAPEDTRSALHRIREQV
jgi:hypothetical protein